MCASNGFEIRLLRPRLSLFVWIASLYLYHFKMYPSFLIGTYTCSPRKSFDIENNNTKAAAIFVDNIFLFHFRVKLEKNDTPIYNFTLKSELFQVINLRQILYFRFSFYYYYAYLSDDFFVKRARSPCHAKITTSVHLHIFNNILVQP